jgi:hypothetical protein
MFQLSFNFWLEANKKIDFDHSTTGFRLVDSHAKKKSTD